MVVDLPHVHQLYMTTVTTALVAEELRVAVLFGLSPEGRFQALRYQGCYRTELLPSLTAEWFESSPPNTGVDGSNPRGLKSDNQKGYVGGWNYPEYYWRG